MSNFQIAVIGIFIFFTLVGVVTFATFGGLGGGAASIQVVTVWGTEPQAVMQDVIKHFTINATYVQKNPATFESDFVNALAEGNGPDVVLMPQSLILKEQAKIYPIPYTTYTDGQFKQTFIQEGELFETKNGILGLPLIVDPLVMYWNRDSLAGAGISLPPTHWDDLYTIIPQLTVKDSNAVISKSTVSFGEYVNVSHAKDILSTLVLQTGNAMVDTSGTNPVSTLSDQLGGAASAEAALVFYTGFADPLKPQYSWNRSLPLSRDDFLAGDLALYFGYASEYADVHNKNPNLNFDVAPVPQVSNNTSSITFGNVEALAIMKDSKNVSAAFHALGLFTQKTTIDYLSNALNLPPVRRDSLAGTPNTSEMSAFFKAALQSRGWLDPDSQATETIFKNMIESVTSGSNLPSGAVNSASIQLGELLRNNATQ
jgi:ABC-type glycerol-3-phosphate transport system substrate-binding protein